MKSVIQQLKDNEKPFGLMSEEMQEKLKSIPGKNIECLQTANKELWSTCEQGIAWNSQPNTSTCTYRLRADYEEEPKIVECAISKQRNGTLGYDRHDGITSCSLGSATSYPDFIGFKFEDGTVFGLPVKYSVPSMTSHGYYALEHDIKTSQALEHHATHILFRRSP